MARYVDYEKVDQRDVEQTSDITAPDDAEDADDVDEHARAIAETRRREHEPLTAEGEAERLLARDEEELGRLARPEASEKRRRDGRHEDQDEHKAHSRRQKEGRAGDSRDSSEVDMRVLGETQAKRRMARASRWCRYALLLVAIMAAFLALLYGAYTASENTDKIEDDITKTGGAGSSQSENSEDRPSITPTLSNGTHQFAPTTILISLDGFRADFLDRGLTPTLQSFIRSGVSPKYMNPSFPSLTFPNHFTLVTGLYPESHGVVGNTFWDPHLQKEFYYTDPTRSMQPEWWRAEPIWETAELAGVRTAIHMWPGSEAHIGSAEPSFVDKFNAKELLDRKVQRVLTWLDLPGADDRGLDVGQTRPQFIAAYVPNVDADGHAFGPNSTYIRSTIAEVDGMLGMLFQGIDERNLTGIVNIIIVSDHGMATTDVHRLIQLEDLIDPSLMEHIDGHPLFGFRPKDSSDSHIQALYEHLRAEADRPQYQGHFDVYTKATMPERYHFHSNDRIAPLWVVPTPGWAIVTRDELNVAAALAEGRQYHPRGLHGYDHEHPLMRAIFVARGPAFPHPKGSQVDVFQNVEVYNMICDSLGIKPVPNNGTLRLPLAPIGLHDFDSPVEPVHDPPVTPSSTPLPQVSNLAYRPSSAAFGKTADEEDYVPQAVKTMLSLPPEVPNLAIRPDLTSPTDAAAEEEEVKVPDPQHHPFEHSDWIGEGGEDGSSEDDLPKRPVVHDGKDGEGSGAKSLWDWTKAKLEELRGWATGAFGEHRKVGGGKDQERR